MVKHYSGNLIQWRVAHIRSKLSKFFLQLTCLKHCPAHTVPVMFSFKSEWAARITGNISISVAGYQNTTPLLCLILISFPPPPHPLTTSSHTGFYFLKWSGFKSVQRSGCQVPDYVYPPLSYASKTLLVVMERRLSIACQGGGEKCWFHPCYWPLPFVFSLPHIKAPLAPFATYSVLSS